jgi:large subunit ribosomal protein L29
MNKAIAEIRGMDSRELGTKLQDLKKEQFGLRFHGSDEQVARSTRFVEIRRTIARILTVLGERARTGNEAPVPVPAPPAGAAKAEKKAKAAKPAKVKAE